jgi:hypothetical protein
MLSIPKTYNALTLHRADGEAGRPVQAGVGRLRFLQAPPMSDPSVMWLR